MILRIALQLLFGIAWATVGIFIFCRHFGIKLERQIVCCEHVNVLVCTFFGETDREIWDFSKVKEKNLVGFYQELGRQRKENELSFMWSYFEDVKVTQNLRDKQFDFEFYLEGE